jgi:hypothetical protein
MVQLLRMTNDGRSVLRQCSDICLHRLSKSRKRSGIRHLLRTYHLHNLVQLLLDIVCFRFESVVIRNCCWTYT